MSGQGADMATPSLVALKVAKKELRTRVKQKLSNISSESITSQSANIAQKAINLKGYQDSKRVGIYLSMPSGEVQTDAIVQHALGNGKQVFVPYLHKNQDLSPNMPKSVMDMVELQSLTDYKSLKRDGWGIPTIGEDTVEEREHILEGAEKGKGLDIIFMPGVAFEIDIKSGFVRRLGHGKGFYDFFLHRYLQNRSAERDGSQTPGEDVLLYGLALEEQFARAETVQSVPVGQHDHLLHGLLVGNGQVVEGPRTA